jgi:hypothetical protein
MKNLVLITSIIDTPSIPLSYALRSVYSCEERFEQTKRTIQTVKEKIPDCEIIIIECSPLDEYKLDYFLKNSNYFVNLYDTSFRDDIYSIAKALGEATMTICAIDYIIQNGIVFDNFIKISGRYFLSENFDYNNFENDCAVIKYCEDDNVLTALYKLPSACVEKWKLFLQNNRDKMIACIGYEVLFADFIKTTDVQLKCIDPIGVNGYIAVVPDCFLNA